MTGGHPKAAALDALTVRMSEVWKASGCSRASCFLWFTLYSASTGSHLAPEAYLLPSEPSVARTGPADIVVVSVTGPRTTIADPDVDTFDVHIRTDNIALFVWLNAGDLSGRFSDNGFLLKDRTKVIEFYTSEENVTCQGLRERITIDTVANYQTT
ncbi:beta-mannosidase-like [Haemaphysalis longicornis]